MKDFLKAIAVCVLVALLIVGFHHTLQWLLPPMCGAVRNQDGIIYCHKHCNCEQCQCQRTNHCSQRSCRCPRNRD